MAAPQLTTLAPVGTVRTAGVGRRTAPDARTLDRWVSALLMPVGPAAIALLRYVLPHDTTNTPLQAVIDIGLHENPSK